MSKDKPSLGRAILRDPKTGEVKIFDLPDDFPQLRALGVVRKGRWTFQAIEKYLANLEAYLEHNIVPGAGERYVGRTGRLTEWEIMRVPDALAGHMETLRKALAMVRRSLASEDLEAAMERTDAIGDLVQNICDRVNRPLIEHSRSFSDKTPEKATEKNVATGTRHADIVIKSVNSILKNDREREYRHKSGRINISKLAKDYTQISYFNSPVQYDMARKIITKAVEEGNLV